MATPGLGVKTRVAVVGLAVVTQAAAAGIASAGIASAGSRGTTTRESVSSTGAQANSQSGFLSSTHLLSADGRYIAFPSLAGNLVPGDTNGRFDVFVRDRLTGVTERVSVGPAGEQGVGGVAGAAEVAISGDGQRVVFTSDESNLVPGDTNGHMDVFERDLRAGVTQLVSVPPAGDSLGDVFGSVSLSDDGRFVAFSGVRPLKRRSFVYVRDVAAGVTERVSVGLHGPEADNGSGAATISADGRFVAFTSLASNLVPGDTNHDSDIFVWDRLARVAERVSVDSAGREAAPGTFVGSPSISADGRFVAFSTLAHLSPEDTDGFQDVYVRDRAAGTTRRVSVAGPAGRKANTNDSDHAAISADGQVVAFDSLSTTLVPGDTDGGQDVFVRNLRTHVTRRVSVSSTGRQGRLQSDASSLSADGRFVAFLSSAPNLVPGDTNRQQDVFVRARW